MLSRFLPALVLALFVTPALAWDYAQDPLAWSYPGEAFPNVALMIDDSTSMHYQMASESYQRVKSGMDSFTISPWYVCTDYNNSTKRCTSVFATALADMAGANTANPIETGITVYQDSLGATVPRYVYQGNGSDDEVPGAALCNVHKNPGDAGFYLGKSGANWLASAAASDIGVLLSRSTNGIGTNDACVRWKLASTGMVGGVDEYTAYPGDYAAFLLTKHAGSTPRSLDFSDAAEYPNIDPDDSVYSAIDDKVIPNITRLESARQLSQTFILNNYKRTQIGLFSLDSEMDRACGDGSNPEADKTALLGLVSEFRATELGSPLARTQTKINNYFKGPTSPIRYRCQKNFSVVVTDGEPDNDTGTLDGAAQTGYDTDAKTSGNDLAGVSWNDTFAGGIWAKQNIVTHAVNLGLENDLLKRTPLVNKVNVTKASIVSNKIPLGSQYFNTGDYIEVVSGAAAGLTNGNYYYIAKIDENYSKLATTKKKSFECAAGTTSACVTITSGSGTMVVSTGPGQSFFSNDMDGVAAGVSEDMASIYALSATVAIATNSKSLDADTLVYQAKFNTQDWSGELKAHAVNTVTGQVNTEGAPVWTTKTTLDSPAKHGALLTWNDTAQSGVTFDWSNLSSAQQTALVSADSVSWLKGNNVLSPAGFRDRAANGVMGDVIHSNVLYVGAKDFGYSQLPAAGNTGAATYNAFVASSASRNPTVFVGANDGMLHGFNANTGAEKVAFIPNGVYEDWNDANKNTVKDAGEVEKKLFNLTQENYGHRLFVDGATTASDAYIGNAWKTYLVGGLGAGGRSVYALDITDNTFSATDVKWEFSHSELGRTYGTPIIARFADNKWYAVFANGPDSASGKASVFVVNLANPVDYHILATNVGNAATPNGMMTVQVKFDTQHTATAIYGGDLQGNIWKFDVHAAGVFPGGTKLFAAKDSAGMQQPITGGITLGEHPYGFGTLVYFGTGKYFEKSDRGFASSSSPQINSFYGILDNGSGAPISRYDLVQQYYSASFVVGNMNFRTSTSNQVNYSGSTKGWYIDLMNGATKQGERVITTPILDNNHIIFSSQISLGDACFSTGSSYLNVLDALDGSVPYDRVLDTNGDGIINSNDVVASSIMLDLQISAPILINNGANSYAFLSSLSPAHPVQRIAIVSTPAVDTDGDGLIDSMDADDDNDGSLDINDYFPLDAAEFLDTDNDGIGNNADTDDDNDGIPDGSDPLPLGVDGSADFDNDGISNAADPDDDNDGIDDIHDAFSQNAAESEDYDHDGTGNNADTDDDNDGVPDVSDVFPFSSAESADSDNDGIGNNADNDGDNDGVPDATDLFPLDSTEAYDSDNDGTGNNADIDDDNDGVPDTSDVFPLNAAESADNDNDGIGNSTDADDDNDGVPDINDAFPFNPREFADNDNDGIGDKADADDDNDGVKDYRDAFPFDASESVDTDGDGVGNNADPDDDDDGVEDIDDAFPLDASESVDSDGDGVGDNADPDDDNDGVLDFQPMQNLYALSASYSHTCALKNDQVVCWGYNDYGQTDVPVLVNPIAVSAGFAHTCAIDATGVHCWGYNDYGQTDVPALVNPVAVSAGVYHTCAIDDSGVHCWGLNSYGETDVPALLNPTAISASSSNTCAIDATGVHCWGSNDEGQNDVPELVNPVAIDATGYHVCAIDQTGVHCWGNNSYGQPDIPALVNPVAISAGVYNHNCAIDDTGVHCWGNDDYGQTDVPELTNPIAVSAGYSHTCAIDDSGVHCWGENNGDAQIIDSPLEPLDNCRLIPNADQQDIDGDAEGDACDNDDDNDGVDDVSDAFPFDANETVDTDSDTVGDNSDNCALLSNEYQENYDGDSQGDICDSDADNDGVQNAVDIFPFDDSESVDTDNDGIGNNADTTPNGDTDNDGIDNLADNCSTISNADQVNTDGDTQGNVCDTDDDNDGVADSSDAFPLDATELVDTDSDTVGDNTDNCVAVANTNQLDTDTDGAGDVCDNTPNGDTDNDGVDNAADNCPLIANSNQLDYDANNIGDACDDAVPLPEDIAGVMKNTKAGSAVAFTGDVNGDGYGDYVVGMPGYDIPAAPPVKIIKGAGRAEVISGKTGAVLMSINGVAAKDAMGFAVAGNGDIDHDGFDDVVVGAPNADNFAFGLADTGSTTILFGPDGRRTQPFFGNTKKSLFGSAVALADVNGDHYADIIIGAPKADDVARSLIDAGNVTVLSGDGYAVLNTFYVAKAKANAGTSVAAGDINYDGKADIIIGAPNDDGATKNLKDAGSVSVYDISGTELLRKYGAVAKAYLGKSVASGNTDNIVGDEVLAGAPGDDIAATVSSKKVIDAGSVTVFFADINKQPVKKYGAVAKAGLGNSVAAGDVNNDGYADIIAGASKDDKPATKVIKDAGSVSVWSGNDYSHSQIGSTVYGNAANDYFGFSVSAGDINSDGKSDLIIGVPGFDALPILPATKPAKEAGGVRVLSGLDL